MEALSRFIPNVLNYRERILGAIAETLQMVGGSLALVIVFGVTLGILLVVISDGHLYENRALHYVLPKLVNLMRSIPFVILIAVMLPVTRIIAGTAIGVRGAMVPIVAAMTPFVARQIELAALEVNPGVIEMALSLGFSKPYIILRILLKESRSGIIRALILSSISLVSFSAMAGVVGGGGIGDLAIRYGYARYMFDITILAVVLLLVLVFSLQGIGNIILKRITH
jgi:D-methionine transport system permease protein